MRKIKLTQGKYAIVDDEDFHYLNRFSWTYAEIQGLSRVFRNVSFFRGRANICMEDFIVARRYGGRHVLVHKNGDRLDFRKKNLVHMVNEAVRHRGRKQKGKYTSDYRGVTRNRGRGKPWRVQIEKGKRGSEEHQRIVRFSDTEKGAARIYNKLAKELYGAHANQNKI